MPQKPKEVEVGVTTNRMAERAEFREVRWASTETISDVLRLCSQARTCEFKGNLEENLLTQFQIGINNKTVRDRISAMSSRKLSRCSTS